MSRYRPVFPDGVYWVTVGIEPMLTRQQGRLAEAVSGEKPSITDVQQGKDCLRQCFAGKQALLILDDLWNTADAKAFAALDRGQSPAADHLRPGNLSLFWEQTNTGWGCWMNPSLWRYWLTGRAVR